MDVLGRSDIILLAIATYFAVMTLVRLMQRRRDQLVSDVQRQVAARKHTKRNTEAGNRNAA